MQAIFGGKNKTLGHKLGKRYHMRVNQRQVTNLLLIIGVVAMATVAWFDYRLRSSVDPETLLIPYDLTEVNELTIERPDVADITLRRIGQTWSIVHPIKIDAKDERVMSFLRVLKQPEGKRYPIHQVNLNKLGLKYPIAVIGIYDTELRFGKLEPTSQQRYLRVGDSVVLVDDYFYQFLTGGVNAFANLEILPTDSRVNAVSINGSLTPFDPVGWEYAKAAAIQPIDDKVEPHALISIQRDQESSLTFALRRHGENYGLQADGRAYEFLIDDSLAELLSLK